MPSCRVLNHSFELPLPYEEGQTLSASEANELNRLRATRIIERARNVIHSRGLGADPQEVRTELEILARDFRFSAEPYRLPPDPAEIEAIKIAKAIVSERLAKLPDGAEAPSVEELSRVVKTIASESRVRAEASRRVELAKRVTQDTLGVLDDLLTPTKTKAQG